jgi:tRNA(Arg) A34 adenosine deaminase TadA
MDTQIVLTLPSWLDAVVAAAGPRFVSDDDKMQLAIALSRENVARGGGPFGAAVFDQDRCVAAGVNRVLDTGYSLAHAEIVAIMAAQQVAAGRASKPAWTLVTSAEPCCQCFGAIVWSGLDRVVCGATTEDVEAIGFDEGPKPAAWQECLRARGIHVTEQVQRAAACAVLDDYRARGGVIYGLRHPNLP